MWRVQQLGWTAEKFQRVDLAIESERHHDTRVGREHHKVDRYGKKYSWIAYFELSGWLRDQDLLNEGDDDDRTSNVDIDPSFPSPTPEHRLVSADFLGDRSLTIGDWINNGPTPDIRPYLRQSGIRGESGPCVALDGYITQQDESRGRRMFAIVRSFLVAKSDAKALAASLTKQSLGGRWLPETPECHYTFAGEVPWCVTFPKNDAVELQFVVKERKVQVRRKRPFFFLDRNPVQLSRIDQLRLGVWRYTTNETEGALLTEKDLSRLVRRDRVIDVEEVQQETRKIRVIIPVHDFGWESRNIDNDSVHGVTLAKQLAQSMGLLHLPQTLDLQTKEGIRATYGIAFRPHEFGNTEHFFFVREDILRTHLQKRGLCLVWAVWGERQLSNKLIERAMSDRDLAKNSRADFQAVHRY